MKYIVVDGVRYSYDFKTCFGGDECSMKKAYIMEGVETIDAYAFRYFSNLEEVYLPSTLKNLGEYSFERCRKLSKISIPTGVNKIPFSCFSDCSGLKEVVLSDTVDEFGGFCFAGCTSLDKLVLFPLIKSIPANSIAHCPNLQIYSDSISISHEEDEPEEGYDITKNFISYSVKDLLDMISEIQENYKDIFSKKELNKVILDEVHKLHFI